jgi:hypothetical protein
MKITSEDYPSKNPLDEMKPGQRYIVDQRITSGPYEPTATHTTVKKVTKGKLKVGFRRAKR